MDSSNFNHFKPEIEKDEVLEDFQEPISQLQNLVKKNQEPVGKELDDSFIAEQMKENPRRDFFSCSRIEDKQDEVFQVKDAITDDQPLILVSNSISPSQNLVELGNWGKLSASGTNNKRMSAEIGSTCIVSGYGCAKIYHEFQMFRRRFAETNSKKDVLSMFVEARNVFCQKKLNGNKNKSYSREEMEVLRFVNSCQQRQIWRENIHWVGTAAATLPSPAASPTPRQHQQHHRNPLQPLEHHQYSQQQQHYHPQTHHQHPRLYQEHHPTHCNHFAYHQYSQQQQHHHQHPKKPPQHHHHHNHHHQLVGMHRGVPQFLVCL
ncbi:hypothetical protein MKX03_027175, partial [Papaver bracteatum]